MHRRSFYALVGLMFLLGGCSFVRHQSTVAPTAVIEAHPVQGNAPLTVQFDGGRSVDDGEIVDYMWDFGDGSEPTTSDGPTVKHRYGHPGVYTARLTATDDDGLAASCTVQIEAINTPPIAGCRFSNDAPVVGERVQFDASGSIDLDGRLVDFVWEFGDGESMRGTRVSHVYSSAGVYTVRLTVEDDAGCTTSITHVIDVHRSSGGGGCSGGGCGGGGISL